MKVGIIITQNNPEQVFTALRFAHFALKEGDKVSVFLAAEGVELHHEEPVALMKEALRVLKPNGMLAVIHWNYESTTPRGPAMEIRPRPEQCIEWGREAGFRFNERNRYDLPPYHYGLLFRKPFA